MGVIKIAILIGSLMPFIYFFNPSFMLCIIAAVTANIAASGVDLAWMNQFTRMTGTRISMYSGIHLSLIGIRGITAPLVGVVIYRYLGMTPIFVLSIVFIILSILPFFYMNTRKAWSS